MATKDEVDDIIKAIFDEGDIKTGLDLGAGDCKCSIYLSEHGVKMDAVDIKDPPQDIDKYGNINYIRGDIRKFDLSDKKYDVIIMRSVLHYLGPQDAEGLLTRIKSHINKGGFVYIFTMTPPPDSERFLYTPEVIDKILSPLVSVKKEEVKTPDPDQPQNIHYSWRLLYRN